MAVTIDGSTGWTYSDNIKHKYGTGEDLEIYHDGSDSYIKHVGTDDLWIVGETDDVNIKAADNIILQPQNGENGVRILGDGAVELYHDNALKFATTADGVNVSDESGAVHLRLYTGTSTLRGYLYADDSDRINLLDGQGHKVCMGQKDGAFNLYYDNSKKLETTSSGIKVESGAATILNLVSNPSYSASIEFGDTDDDDEAQIWYDNYGKTFNFRTSEASDLVFYRDGTENTRITSTGLDITAQYIKHTPASSFYIRSGGNILIEDINGGNYFKGETSDKSAEAYFDNALKFETTSTGIGLHGLSTGTGNSTLHYNSSSGQVTYDTSSRLVKIDITDSPYGIDIVKQLKPRKYKRTDQETTPVEIGFIADEVQSLIPEIVPTGPKSIYTKNHLDTEIIPVNVDYQKLTVVLTTALQEAITKIEILETKVAALEAG